MRKENKISQKNLANILGCHQSMVSQWENNICEPTESYIVKASIFFRVSTDYLLGLEDESGRKTYVRTNIKNNINSISNNGGNITFN